MAEAIDLLPSKLDRLDTEELLVGMGGGTGDGTVGWLARSRSSAVEDEVGSTAVAGMESLWGSCSSVVLRNLEPTSGLVSLDGTLHKHQPWGFSTTSSPASASADCGSPGGLASLPRVSAVGAICCVVAESTPAGPGAIQPTKRKADWVDAWATESPSSC